MNLDISARIDPSQSIYVIVQTDGGNILFDEYIMRLRELCHAKEFKTMKTKRLLTVLSVVAPL